MPLRQGEEMEGFSPGWTGWGAGEEQPRSMGEEGLVLTTPSLVKASWPRDGGADSPGSSSRRGEWEDELVLDACLTVFSGAWIFSNCYVPSI